MTNNVSDVLVIAAINETSVYLILSNVNGTVTIGLC